MCKKMLRCTVSTKRYLCFVNQIVNWVNVLFPPAPASSLAEKINEMQILQAWV